MVIVQLLGSIQVDFTMQQTYSTLQTCVKRSSTLYSTMGSSHVMKCDMLHLKPFAFIIMHAVFCLHINGGRTFYHKYIFR